MDSCSSGDSHGGSNIISKEYLGYLERIFILISKLAFYTKM